MAEKAPPSRTKSGESAGCKTTPVDELHEGDKPSHGTQPTRYEGTTKVQEMEEAEKEELERYQVSVCLPHPHPTPLLIHFVVCMHTHVDKG